MYLLTILFISKKYEMLVFYKILIKIHTVEVKKINFYAKSFYD